MAKPIRFPRQHTLSFSVEHSDRLQAEADENEMSLSEVARVFFDAGIRELDAIKAKAAEDPDDGS